MMHRTGMPRGALTAALAGVLLASCTHAAEGDRSVASLRLVPANAAFYSVMLRNKEQWNALVNSKAVARLKELPAVKQGLDQLDKELKNNPQFKAFQQLMEQPENQELAALLSEAVADEIFITGGSDWGDFAALAAKLNSANQYGMIQLMASGKGLGGDPNRLRVTALLMALADNPTLVKFPATVIGFRLPNSKKADAQLKRLEAVGNLLSELMPQAKGRFKRVEINEGSYLSVDLDGSLIPWDRVSLKEFELDDGQFDNLVKQLKGLKLQITLGVRGNWLLLGLGSSTDLLKQLGKEPSLGASAYLKPLARYADRPLTSVDYISKALRQRLATNPKDLDSLVETAKQGLDKTPLDDAQKKKILKDVAELVDDMKKSLPAVGAAVALSFWSERGQESYAFEEASLPEGVKPRPLSLLNHLGGAPILGAVAPTNVDGSGYRALAKYARKLWGHVDDIITPMLDGEKKEVWDKVKKASVPLWQRFDEITTTLFLPSLADGQIGLVLDGKLTSKQWIMALPPADKPLPMLEIAIVLGIKDGEKFTRALADYRKWAQDVLATIRTFDQAGNMPEITIPAPKSVKKGAATYYHYPIPEQAGLDGKLVPTAGISAKVAVFTIAQETAERLLASKPLRVKGAALADPEKPLLGAAVFDFPQLMDMLKPWVEYTMQVVGQPKAQEAGKQVLVILDVLKCYRGSSSITYVEDGKTVTHSITVIRDLEK